LALDGRPELNQAVSVASIVTGVLLLFDTERAPCGHVTEVMK